MIHRLLSAPTRAPFALLVLGTVPAALPALPQDDPAEGFALDPVAVAPPTLPGGPFGATVFGAARTLSNGDVVTFDGQTILRLASDGTPLATLGVLPAIAFTGCFAIDPAETLAVVGESSTGEVYRVPLDGSGMTLLTNLTFNYDAVFEDADTVLISAATGVSGNDLVRVDVNTGATTCVALVPSFSGPLAVDPAGGLYYGLQTSPAQVIHWTAGQLDGGACLSELDATVVGDGFAGSTSMAVDPTHGDLYMSVNDFSTGSNRIVRVEGDASVSPVLVEGTTPFHSLSGLQFETGVDGAVFFPYQPAFGGALRYTSADFVAFNERFELRPLRPQLQLSGPGTSGPGEVTLTLTGAPASGSALVLYGLTSAWGPSETGYHFGLLPPLFSGFPLAAIAILPGALALDGAGGASAQAFNPGGLEGQVTVQALVLDSFGAFVGTTGGADL